MINPERKTLIEALREAVAWFREEGSDTAIHHIYGAEVLEMVLRWERIIKDTGDDL